MVCFPFLRSVLGCRGDRGGRRKHGVLPWRAGQCEHSQHQRPGWPQQPAEHGQRWGLLFLQCQTCLLLLEPRTTSTATATTSSLPNPPVLPSVYPSSHAYVRTPSHLRRRLRHQLTAFLSLLPLSSAPLQLLAFSCPPPSLLLRCWTHCWRSSTESSSSPLNFEPHRPTPGTQTQWCETANWF